MLPLNPDGAPVTDEQINAALTYADGTRDLRFCFERLSPEGIRLGDITGFVTACSIENNALADIKRTAKFRIDAAAPIDFLRDQIQPWALLEVDGSTVAWPLGVFLLTAPSTPLGEGGVIEREIDAYDRLIALRDQTTTSRYTVPAGTSYTEAVRLLVEVQAGLPVAIISSPRSLPAPRDWDPGTSFLEVVNDLLGAINYKSATFDAYGTFVAEPYVPPGERPVGYSYATDANSVIGGEPVRELDLLEVPNDFYFYVSEPDRPPLSIRYENRNPDSPTSIVSRGRRITEVTQSEAPDLEVLRAQAARRAQAATQVYEAVEFDTALMPFHGDFDVYSLSIDGLDVDDIYSEQTWSFDCVAGASMRHRARRIVSV